MLEWAEAAYKKKLRKRPDKESQEKVPTNGPKNQEYYSHVDRNMKKKSPLKRGREFGSHVYRENI